MSSKDNKGSDKRGLVLAIVGLLLLSWLVNNLPFERQSSGLTEWLYHQGEMQEQNSNIITDAVAGVIENDGRLVGEHQVNGSNWSIPNIIRHWLLGG